MSAEGAAPGESFGHRVIAGIRRADAIEGVGATLAIGLVLSILTWFVSISSASTGLDQGWIGGLYMGIHDGIRFGPDFVFTYGPLGFLNFAVNWYPNLAVLAFAWLSALHIAFACLLVATLRRSVGMIASVLVAYLILTLLPAVEVPFAITALWSFSILRDDRPRGSVGSVAIGGAMFAAIETLVKLSVGPPLFLMFGIALIGARARPWQLVAYPVTFALTLTALWLASGQHLGDLPDFVTNGRQIVSGYSEAMSTRSGSTFTYTAGVLLAVGVLVTLVAGASFASYRDNLARWCGVGVMFAGGFALFKTGVVRFDLPHMGAYAASASVLWLALPWDRPKRWMLAAVAVPLIIAGISIQHYRDPDRVFALLDPIANVERARDQIDLARGSYRLDALDEFARATIQSSFEIAPEILERIEGRSVEVEPWEIAAAWAYDLDWHPVPVIQAYQANTKALDELNADTIRSPGGPERILRHNPAQATEDWPTRTIDDRFPGWDPPEQALATLCNFEIAKTTPAWQLLSRVPDRCGEPRKIGSVDTEYGDTVEVPQAGLGQVVFARIDGAEVSGLESILSLLYKASFRHVTVNGSETYRLIPDTAGDGLLLNGPPQLVGEGIYAQAPQAETLKLTGPGGDLRYDFYVMDVEQTRAERAAARGGS